ncbi:Acidic endochitinase WIN6.2B [Capsicum chinense]|nr:Acidic endochitinase WIN6.2B [Capsicum chinense]
MRLHLITIHKMRRSSALVSLLALALFLLLNVSANPSHPFHLPTKETILGQLELAVEPGACGEQAGGKECPPGLCCAQWGFCGTGPEYCGDLNAL